jgi:hypothetical protein
LPALASVAFNEDIVDPSVAPNDALAPSGRGVAEPARSVASIASHSAAVATIAVAGGTHNASSVPPLVGIAYALTWAAPRLA